MGDVDDVVRIAALRRLCGTTADMLGDVVADCKRSDQLGLAFAAAHLQDSLRVFAETAEREILAGRS